MGRFVCLIPSFNEEKTIGWLVRILRDKGFDAMVIDDGSSDSTAKLAHNSGAEVIINECNLGKGASLRKAFEILKHREQEAIIILDGDGQHLPEDIDPFIEAFDAKKGDIIVGNRMHRPKGMPLVRWVTNSFMSGIVSGMCKQRVPDTQCGYRLVSTPVLNQINLKTERFEIESEMLLEAAAAGFRISSVPITSIYEGQYSAIHPWRDTVRFFKFVFRKRDKSSSKKEIPDV